VNCGGVVASKIGIGAIYCRFVQVRSCDARPQVVRDYLFCRAAKVAEGADVRSNPIRYLRVKVVST
jgi:hypothetical protein